MAPTSAVYLDGVAGTPVAYNGTARAAWGNKSCLSGPSRAPAVESGQGNRRCRMVLDTAWSAAEVAKQYHSGSQIPTLYESRLVNNSGSVLETAELGYSTTGTFATALAQGSTYYLEARATNDGGVDIGDSPISTSPDGWYRVGSLAVPDVLISYLASYTDTDAKTVYNFGSVGVGAAHANRSVIIAVTTRDTADITPPTVTIGGVEAVVDAELTNFSTNACYVGLFRAKVPTGTSGEVVVTFAETKCCGVACKSSAPPTTYCTLARTTVISTLRTLRWTFLMERASQPESLAIGRLMQALPGPASPSRTTRFMGAICKPPP